MQDLFHASALGKELGVGHSSRNLRGDSLGQPKILYGVGQGILRAKVQRADHLVPEYERNGKRERNPARNAILTKE